MIWLPPGGRHAACHEAGIAALGDDFGVGGGAKLDDFRNLLGGFRQDDAEGLVAVEFAPIRLECRAVRRFRQHGARGQDIS